MSIPRQSSNYDERRNSSRVFPVPPDALPNALRALVHVEPALRRWIEAGHPRLTHDDHVSRFGEPYHATRSRRS